MRNLSASTISGITLVLSSAAAAQMVYVDRDNHSGVEDGTSWATAFKTIQPGIDSATAGDEVWVAQGVYDEPRVIVDSNGNPGSLILRNGISLFGGFGGGETTRDERALDSCLTVIDGSTARNGDNAYHVVLSEEELTNVVIDGFKITGGRAELNPTDLGGGLLDYGGVTVTNCSFENNYASANGGGLAGSGPVIDCTFRENSARFAAGASVGGEPLVKGCVFENNHSEVGPSALDVRTIDSVSTVEECSFIGNRISTGLGTNVGAVVPFGDIRMTNCLFVDNSAVGSGSAGAIFHGGSLEPNSAVPATRGVYVNCTFVGNSSPGGSVLRFGQVNVHFDNCIVWGNSDPWFVKSAPISPAWIFNCVLQSDSTDIFDEAIGGNIFADPLFVNPTGQDLRLRPESPAIDMGHAMRTTPPIQIDAGFVVIPPDDDMDGTPRPLGAGFDIGAYEFDPAVSFEDPFDPTGDQMSDAADLQHVINQVLGTTTTITDLNNDGQTNAADIQLMTNWLLGII